jgi:hypothetical protein
LPLILVRDRRKHLTWRNKGATIVAVVAIAWSGMGQADEDSIELRVFPSDGRWSAGLEDVSGPDRLFLLDGESGEVYELTNYAGKYVRGLKWGTDGMLAVDVEGKVEVVQIEFDGAEPRFFATPMSDNSKPTFDMPPMAGSGGTRSLNAHEATARQAAVRAVAGSRR